MQNDDELYSSFISGDNSAMVGLESEHFQEAA